MNGIAKVVVATALVLPLSAALVVRSAELLSPIEQPTVAKENVEGQSALLTDSLAQLELAQSGASENLISKYLDAVMENGDTVGWIDIPEYGVSYPVVQGEDNKEYLRTSFSGEPDVAGTIFLDSRCNLDTAGCLKIIHGHNMKDGRMFASLPQMLRLRSTADAPTIYWYSPSDGVAEYVVVSVLSLDSTKESLGVDGWYSLDDLAGLKEQLVERSYIPVWTEASGTDLLLLNTCWYGESGRQHNLHCVVVAGRK